MEREVVEIGGQRDSKASTISLQGLQSRDFDTLIKYLLLLLLLLLQLQL